MGEEEEEKNRFIGGIKRETWAALLIVFENFVIIFPFRGLLLFCLDKSSGHLREWFISCFLFHTEISIFKQTTPVKGLFQILRDFITLFQTPLHFLALIFDWYSTFILLSLSPFFFSLFSSYNRQQEEYLNFEKLIFKNPRIISILQYPRISVTT